jgi:tRNA (guanine-N7-)-methyltransferase
MTIQHRKLSTLSLPWPTDWPEVFDTIGQDRPLIVEIGFGYGQMLFHLSEQFPDANIIGVEVASRPIETVERRLRSHGVHNVRVVYGYAETSLYHLLEPESVEQIHINFPDPWFKSGHAHRRVMKRLTVDGIVSRLKPGGMFYLATDIDAYAEMSHDILTNTPGLTNQFATPWADCIDNRVTTKYEAKAIREGRTNKYFAYQRNNHAAPSIPVLTEAPMPNIVFKSASGLQTSLDRFDGHTQSFSEQDIHVSVMNVFHRGETLLFEVFVKEPTVDQHIGFLVVPSQSEPGQYTLKLASFGHPRATDGIHKAASVVDAIIQQHAPDYEPVHRKIRE